MSSFWPDGLEISDTQSPRDILNTAQEEWQRNSNGILDLVLQDAKSESGNSMIIVHAKHVVNNRTATLFSIIHQPEKPYPVTIQPEEEDLPTFLKKSYYDESALNKLVNQSKLDYLGAGLSAGIPALRGRLNSEVKPVVNNWVSDTPSEFRNKLSEAFNLGIVKREILNLATANLITAKINNEDLIDNQDPI